MITRDFNPLLASRVRMLGRSIKEMMTSAPTCFSSRRNASKRQTVRHAPVSQLSLLSCSCNTRIRTLPTKGKNGGAPVSPMAMAVTSNPLSAQWLASEVRTRSAPPQTNLLVISNIRGIYIISISSPDWGWRTKCRSPPSKQPPGSFPDEPLLPGIPEFKFLPATFGILRHIESRQTAGRSTEHSFAFPPVGSRPERRPAIVPAS